MPSVQIVLLLILLFVKNSVRSRHVLKVLTKKKRPMYHQFLADDQKKGFSQIWCIKQTLDNANSYDSNQISFLFC